MAENAVSTFWGGAGFLLALTALYIYAGVSAKENDESGGGSAWFMLILFGFLLCVLWGVWMFVFSLNPKIFNLWGVATVLFILTLAYCVMGIWAKKRKEGWGRKDNGENVAACTFFGFALTLIGYWSIWIFQFSILVIPS